METFADANNLLAGIKRIEHASGWKESVQKISINKLRTVYRLQKELCEGCYQPGEEHVFTVNERGHIRAIRALEPYDLILQHSLCDSILYPKLTKYLIYDNGASLKGKGVSFTRKRLEEHLRKFYLNHGCDGYILLIDFRKFFDNIDHEKLLAAFNSKVPEVMDFLKVLLRQYEIPLDNAQEFIAQPFNYLDYLSGKYKTGSNKLQKSLGIGSPLSQIAGIFFPTTLDNYCKIVKGCKYYGAYMDDRYVIHKSKDFLKELLQEITVIAQSLGLFINERKTQIIKLSHGFKFLQTKYNLTASGKIIKRLPHSVIVRERRKLKKLAAFVICGELTLAKFRQQYLSWRGDKKNYNAYKTITSMDKLYGRLIKWITRNKKSNKKSAT